MKTIFHYNTDISSLWGEQAVKDSVYRLMRYTVFAECDEGVLALNTITGEMVLLEGDERIILEKKHFIPDALLNKLIAHHFLVPVDYNETEAVYKLRKIIKRLQTVNEITVYTILPTSACNARCFYCYESDFPHVTMSSETADLIIDFISTHCGDKKSVRLHWFGGEPMLGAERIEQICDGLEREGISFRSRMTSNGSLFNKEIAKRAKDHWHLYDIQITLDGTEQIYCRSKSYAGFNGNPYRTVLENIGHLLSLNVHVIIRINLGLHNVKVLENLIQEIGTLFGQYNSLSVYIGVLFNDMGFQKVHYSQTEIAALEAAKEDLKKEIEKAGIRYAQRPRFPYLNTSHCMADNYQAVLISPQGNIGKCEHAVFDKLIGDVESGFLDKEKIKNWEVIHKWDECEACCIYPGCVMLENCDTLKPCIGTVYDFRINEVKKTMTEIYQHGTS